MAHPSLLLLPLLSGLPTLVAGDGDSSALFAEPVMLTAGSKPMGRGILYPSPHMFDVDGDGQDEIVMGDLWGVLHVSKKLPGDDPMAWSEATPLQSSDGEKLKFSNW